MLRDKQIAFSFFSPTNGAPMREHIKFFAKALRAALGQSPETIFHFGGGIRGGKTYTTLFTIYTIARMFPGTKVYIVRESGSRLPLTQKRLAQ